MSGIAGLLRFDGQTVAPNILERAANTLRAHGPDRSGTFIAGPVGLVHVLMRMTPEDQFDRQPWRGASGAVITADLRLDNRDAVLARIGIAPRDALDWADSRVLLTAWEKFGDDIWSTLRGPFAVAIWDPLRRVLTLARDHLGLNVVMWHRTDQFFAFATMPKGLFALPGVPRELNEEKFADFLVLNHSDLATTMYRNIFRTLPAHVMRVNFDGTVTERRYWATSDIKSVRLESDLAARALGEGNRRLAAFTQVPRERFNGLVPRSRYADETPYVEAIRAAIGNIDVTYVRNDACDDFAELDRFFIACEAPVRNVTNLGWMLAIPRLARAQGRRVLLSGQYGNYTISWPGWSQAIDHLLSGRLLTAYRQWLLFYRRSPYSLATTLNRLFVEPLISTGWRMSRRRRVPPAFLAHAAIRPDFAAAMSVEARATTLGHDFHYRMQRGERMRSLDRADYIGDWYAAWKALTGVEVRDPTADLDVVSYCFGIPPEQYLAEGIDRSLVRRAMWGLLPEAVLTNRLGGLQSADWYEKLEGRRDALAAEIAGLTSSPLVRRAIDLDRLDRAIKNWPAQGWQTIPIIEEYQLALTRGVAGGRFLRWMESANR